MLAYPISLIFVRRNTNKLPHSVKLGGLFYLFIYLLNDEIYSREKNSGTLHA